MEIEPPKIKQFATASPSAGVRVFVDDIETQLESELREALEDIKDLRNRAKNTSVGGNVQFNPGWHLALDLKNMLDISEYVLLYSLFYSKHK